MEHKRVVEESGYCEDWERDGGRNRASGLLRSNLRDVSMWEYTSYFVLNMPFGVTVKELRQVFGKFGIVKDVYIAARVDKYGSPFGFVKFVNFIWSVSIGWETLSTGKRVLLVLLGWGGGGPVHGGPVTSAGRPAGSGGDAKVVPGRSFAVVAGSSGVGLPPVKEVIISETSSGALDSWARKSLIGKAKDLKRLYTLNEWME
ncbi:hypothetical protein SSX86_004058 [Deinandra increscens subsp. villosa]|uniref:RRM domain-containing protein n=1 Tax=Deinandra increscens subsp. villosa TaxID=3103831 RepID=A0AAP0DR86_9ASTR